MDSNAFFIVFALLTLLLAAGTIAVVIWLSRQTIRSVTAAQADSRTPFTEALEVMERLAAEHRESLESSSQRLLEMALQEAQRSQLATMTALEAYSRELTRGASSQTQSMTKLVTDTVNLLATKDPIAYQQVSGAQNGPLYETAPQAPYTTADQEGLLQTVQAQDEADRMLQRLMNGELGDVGQHTFGPFVDFAAEQPAQPDHGAPQ